MFIGVLSGFWGIGLSILTGILSGLVGHFQLRSDQGFWDRFIAYNRDLMRTISGFLLAF